VAINKYLTLTIFVFTLLCAINGDAQWSTDPSNNLIVGYGLLPELCSDSAGGCYITYEQGTTYPRHLILERLNRYGYKPWGTGKRISGLLPEQAFAKITEDGRNGVIISYLDVEVTGTPHLPVITSRLRVQRIDSSGNLLWGINGVRLSLTETNPGDQEIVSDGQGGCIVAWVDTLGDLRINRINSEGVRSWGDSGKYVWNSPARPPMVADGQGGCYIIYGIGRLQHFRQDGNLYWQPQGVLIPTGARTMRMDQDNVCMLGGRYIGYNGQAIFSINFQKVDSSGSLLWDSLGVILDTLNTNNNPIYDFSTQSGYSTIAWRQNLSSVWDLCTQIVRSDGSTVFAYGGQTVSKISSDKGIVGVLSSNSLTSIFVWSDQRTPGGIYAQKLDTTNKQLWDTNDVVVNIPMFGDMYTTTNCAEGVIGVGFHQYDFSIRALELSSNGKLGEVITGISNECNIEIPKSFTLFQNYPNPFNPTTHIKFDLKDNSFVKLTVYDILGREVKILVNEYRPAGSYDVEFSVRDGSASGGNASKLPSGIYFYKIQAGIFVDVKKMLLIR
jgi:hypothetical protein